MGDNIGKITEVTGDRKVEAKGRVQQDASDPDDAATDVGAAAVEETETVRREHHDIG